MNAHRAVVMAIVSLVTPALEGWVDSFTSRSLYPRGNSYGSPWMEARWAPQPMWTLWEINKLFPPTDWTAFPQPSRHSCTDNAIRAVAVKTQASVNINNTEYFFGRLHHTQHFRKTSVTKQIIKIVDVIKISCNLTANIFLSESLPM